MEGIEVLSYDEARQLCSESCPYAALMLVSCLGKISHSRLTYFVDGYTLTQSGQHSGISQSIINSLLRNGHLYELRGGFYSALPPYAIQRKLGEWAVLGDARVDRYVAEKTPSFRVRSSLTDEGVFLERLVLADPEDAMHIFQASGVRPFKLAELVELVPDGEWLSAPLPWPDLVPGAYAKWEVLNKRGRWKPVGSLSDVKEGVCRGLVVDTEGRTVLERYFFRRSSNWSPITCDEARLWAFRMAALADNPYVARFLSAERTLAMPLGLPYAAYVVLRYLGERSKVRSGQLMVYGVDYEIAQIVCKKLQIRLEMEVDS